MSYFDKYAKCVSVCKFWLVNLEDLIWRVLNSLSNKREAELTIEEIRCKIKLQEDAIIRGVFNRTNPLITSFPWLPLVWYSFWRPPKFCLFISWKKWNTNLQGILQKAPNLKKLGLQVDDSSLKETVATFCTNIESLLLMGKNYQDKGSITLFLRVSLTFVGSENSFLQHICGKLTNLKELVLKNWNGNNLLLIKACMWFPWLVIRNFCQFSVPMSEVRKARSTTNRKQFQTTWNFWNSG